MKKFILLAITSVVLTIIAACGAAQPETVTVLQTVVVEKEVEKIVTVEVEKEVVKEVAGEALIMRAVFPSSIDIDDVAALLAFEKMQDEGFAIVPTFYAQGELAAAAVANGRADFGVGTSTVWLSAIHAGSPIVGIMAQVANGWSVMGIDAVESCKDVDGMRTAIHSEGSVSTAMLRAWIDSNCPDAEPKYLVIPGSENRAAALMAGEIDVTPAELIDAIRIMELRPGEFHRVANFATDLPGLKTGGFWVRTDFAEENPEVVKSFIRNVLEVHRRISDEPEWFIEQVPRFLEMEEEDVALLPTIVDALLSIDNYPVNGGLTEESGQYSIDFFTDIDRLEPGLTSDTAFDLSYLNEVLDEIGRR